MCDFRGNLSEYCIQEWLMVKNVNAARDGSFMVDPSLHKPSHGGFSMGAIANAIFEYARPLIDASDGSIEQLNKALAISQACWNIAVLPMEMRESGINSLRETFSEADGEFEYFHQSILLPMIRRYEEMFLRQHPSESIEPPHWNPRLAMPPTVKSRKEKSSKPGRYDPCPCNSGSKYKFCCGRMA